ncbi:MAG: hypothetical protein EZS28_030584 [Streblomastix strix]|uniref:Uncharacterized protein n=1 Tax=Streblomastix strix TaxID=222440 RepID=A0A5J4UTX3_9EUKA|nr:MAG: hypothetical protein EZS28_030584 [Streblomastix strix]
MHLGVGHILHQILGVGFLFLFLESCTGLIAFGVFCGLVFSNRGYICLFSPLLLGCEVVSSVGVGSSFGTPKGPIGYGHWLACFASNVMVPNSGGVMIKSGQLLDYEMFEFPSSCSRQVV